eukprot:COSAG04_NODE_51_length_31064_cov_38.384789_9_plen_5190_part_00
MSPVSRPRRAKLAERRCLLAHGRIQRRRGSQGNASALRDLARRGLGCVSMRALGRDSADSAPPQRRPGAGRAGAAEMPAFPAAMRGFANRWHLSPMLLVLVLSLLAQPFPVRGQAKPGGGCGQCKHGHCNKEGECQCNLGYTGAACDKDACTSSPCLNGGTCVHTGSGFVCLCVGTGYSGDTCERGPCPDNSDHPSTDPDVCRCDAGFSIGGRGDAASVSWDTSSGAWGGTCEPNTCLTDPAVPDHAVFSGDGCKGKTTHQQCEYRCNKGYRASFKTGSIECSTDGTFSEAAACVADLCEAPQLPAHATWADGSCAAHTGEDCSYTCQAGYEPAPGGTGRISCRADGFTEAAGCQAKACTPPAEGWIAHSSWKSGNACTGRTEDTCFYTCDKGYRGNGQEGVIRCLPSGSFEQAAGACQAETCTPPDQPDHSHWRSPCAGKTTDQTCEYICELGYRANHNSGHITCGTNGQFSTGQCGAERCDNPETPKHSSWAASCTSKTTTETCGYNCDAGFRLESSTDRDASARPSHVESSTIECQPSGRFSEAVCQDIDECDVDNGGCSPGLNTCHNTPGSFSCACAASQCCAGGRRQAKSPVFPGQGSMPLCKPEAECVFTWGETGCIGPAVAGQGYSTVTLMQCKDLMPHCTPESEVVANANIIAGMDLRLVVEPKDANGKQTAENGVTSSTTFAVTVSQSAGGTSERLPLHFAQTDTQPPKPRYEGTFARTNDGRYTVTASLHLHGERLGANDFTIVPASPDHNTVTAAGTDSSQELAAECLSQGRCAHVNTSLIYFDIRIFDKFDNLRVPGQLGQASLEPATIAKITDSTIIESTDTRHLQCNSWVSGPTWSELTGAYHVSWSCASPSTDVTITAAGLNENATRFQSSAVNMRCANVQRLLRESESPHNPVESGQGTAVQLSVSDPGGMCHAHGTWTCTKAFDLKRTVRLRLHGTVGNAQDSPRGDWTVGPDQSPDCPDSECLGFSWDPLQVAGQYEIKLTILEETCETFGWHGGNRVLVVPAELDITKLTWMRTQHTQGSHAALFDHTVAGRPNIFGIQPHDRFGNVRNRSSVALPPAGDVDALRLTVTGPSPSAHSTVVDGEVHWDISKSAFVLRHELVVVGTYYFTVKANEEVVRRIENKAVDSAAAGFQVDVVPGVLDVSRTRHSEDLTLVAGETLTLLFATRDEYGNVRKNNDTLTATVRPVDDDHGRAVVNTRKERDRATITQQSWDGDSENYVVTFKSSISLAAGYDVDVNCTMKGVVDVPNALPVKDSPFHIDVRPSEFDVSQCRPNSGGSQCAPAAGATEAGYERRFDVVPRDSYGNVRDFERFNLEEDVINVVVTGPENSDASEAHRQVVWTPSPGYWTGQSQTNPRFVVSWSPTQKGTYMLQVNLGDSIHLSPRSAVQIFAAEPKAEQSQLIVDLTGSDSNARTAADKCAKHSNGCSTPPGLRLAFRVRVKDMYSNERIPDDEGASTDRVRLSSHPPSAIELSPEVGRPVDWTSGQPWPGYPVWFRALADELPHTTRFTVSLAVRNDTLSPNEQDKFDYMASVANPDELDDIVSLITPLPAQVTAGTNNQMKLRIRDDGCLDDLTCTAPCNPCKRYVSSTRPDQCCSPEQFCAEPGDFVCPPGQSAQHEPSCCTGKRCPGSKCTGCSSILGSCDVCPFGDLQYTEQCTPGAVYCKVKKVPTCIGIGYQYRCTKDCTTSRKCSEDDYDSSPDDYGCTNSKGLKDPKHMYVAATFHERAPADSSGTSPPDFTNAPEELQCESRAVCLDYAFTLTTVGIYDVVVRTPHGELSFNQASPFQLTVNPAALNSRITRFVGLPGEVSLTSPGFEELFAETVAGRPNAFAVQPCDGYGNVRDQTPGSKLTLDEVDTVTLAVYGPDQVSTRGPPRSSAQGTWDPTVFAFVVLPAEPLTKAGPYTFRLSLTHGQPFREGADFPVTVIPDVLDVTKTIRHTHNSTHAGDSVDWSFVARDKFENHRNNNDTLSVKITPPSNDVAVYRSRYGQQSYSNCEANAVVRCVRTQWTGTAYQATFSLEISLPDQYKVAVGLSMKSVCEEAGECTPYANRPQMAAAVGDFYLLVNPNKLDIHSTDVKTATGQVFEESSADWECGDSIAAGTHLFVAVQTFDSVRGPDRDTNVRWFEYADTVIASVSPSPRCTSPQCAPPPPPHCPGCLASHSGCDNSNCIRETDAVRAHFEQLDSSQNETNQFLDSGGWTKNRRLFSFETRQPGQYVVQISVQPKPWPYPSANQDYFDNAILPGNVPMYVLSFEGEACKVNVIPGPVEAANSDVVELSKARCLDDGKCQDDRHAQQRFAVHLFDAYGNARSFKPDASCQAMDDAECDGVRLCQRSESQAESFSTTTIRPADADAPWQLTFDVSTFGSTVDVEMQMCGGRGSCETGLLARRCGVNDGDRYATGARITFKTNPDPRSSSFDLAHAFSLAGRDGAAGLSQGQHACPYALNFPVRGVSRYVAGSRQTFNATVFDDASTCVITEASWSKDVGCVSEQGYNLGARIPSVARPGDRGASKGLLLELVPLERLTDLTPNWPRQKHCGSAAAECERTADIDKTMPEGWMPCWTSEAACASMPPQGLHRALLHFSYTITVAGSYEARLFYKSDADGVQILLDSGLRGSLIQQVTVTPSDLDHTKSTTTLAQLQQTEAGRETKFWTYPRDRYGNIRDQKDSRWGGDGLVHDDIHVGVEGPAPCTETDSGLCLGVTNCWTSEWDDRKAAFLTSFRFAISGDYTKELYHFTVQLSSTGFTGDSLSPGCTSHQALSPEYVGGMTGPLTVQVIAAALNPHNTLAFGPTSARFETFAGKAETFNFVLRDQYGNSRRDNDTIAVTLICNSCDEADRGNWWGPITSQRQSAEPVVSTYSSGTACGSLHPNDAGMKIGVCWQDGGSYSVEFTTLTSGQFSVGVKVKQGTTLTPVNGSQFDVFVRPADLSVQNAISDGLYPQQVFTSTEAGRLSTFSVIPCDQYGNIRALNVFGLSDRLNVTLGEEHAWFDARNNHTTNLAVLRIRWDRGELTGGDANAPRFSVSFNESTMGNYSLSLALSDERGNHAPHSVPGQMLPMHGQLSMRVFAAALFPANTVPDCNDTAFAGELNACTFVVKDMYGNVRENNDTITAQLSRVDTKSWWGPIPTERHYAPAVNESVQANNAGMQITRASWDQSGSYRVEFKTQTSGHYKVDVQVAMKVEEENDRYTDTFPVFVRPADLSVQNAISDGLYPQQVFTSTEAGRLSTFSVIPCDQYGNIRALNVFGLSDRLNVTLGEEHAWFDARNNHTTNLAVLRIRWDRGELTGGDANAPRFSVSFNESTMGDYGLTLTLSDIARENARHSVSEKQVLPTDGALNIHVFAAALCPRRTQHHVAQNTHVEAGSNHAFWFQLRDRFDNVREGNDTLHVTFTTVDTAASLAVWKTSRRPRPDGSAPRWLSCTGCKDYTDPDGDFAANPAGMEITDVAWTDASQGYKVQFTTTTTGSYTLSVDIGHGEKRDDSVVTETAVVRTQVPAGPFSVTVFPAPLYASNTWTSVNLTKCQEHGCDDYYAASVRTSASWNPRELVCRQSGCIFEGASETNTIRVQLYDVFGNARNSSDNVKINFTQMCDETSQHFEYNVPSGCDLQSQEPKQERCAWGNDGFHNCNFAPQLSGNYSIGLSAIDVPTPHSLPVFCAGEWPHPCPAELTYVEIGPGPADPNRSVIYVDSPDAQQVNVYGKYTDLNDQWRNDYVGDPVSLKVDARDSYGNRRYGLDTLIVVFTQVGTGKIESGNGHDPHFADVEDPLVFFTDADNNATKDSIARQYDVFDSPQAKCRAEDIRAEDYCGQTQRIEWAKQESDYSYQFSVGFPARGVWQAAAWLCNDMPECMGNTSQIKTSATTAPPPDDVDSSAPLHLIICQQNTKHALLNATRLSQQVRVPLLADATNEFTPHVNSKLKETFHEVLNSTCLCEPGWFQWTKYHDVDGGECWPCPRGTFQDQYGQLSCMNCSSGTYSACWSISDPTDCFSPHCKANPDDKTATDSDRNCPNHSPAAKRCKPCSGRDPSDPSKGAGSNEAGTYAWNTGQDHCTDCEAGFKCDQDGMVYPVAGEGYWVSPTDPLNVQKCSAEACPGGKLSNISAYHPDSTWAAAHEGYPDWVRSHPGYDLTDEQCFKKPWSRLPHDHTAEVCPLLEDTYTPVPLHQKVQHLDARSTPQCASAGPGGNLQSSKPVPDCWKVIGATCNPGYTGDGCTTCCKNCKPDKAAQDCQSEKGKTDPSCIRMGIVTENYRHDGEGKCVPCPQYESWAVALMGFGFVAGLLLLGPVVLKFGDALKHAGEMTAPLMTIISFFQTVSLFRNLHIHWPQQVKDFFKLIEDTISLLNLNIEMFHPECTLALSFEEQWLLQIFSPIAVLALLGCCLLMAKTMSLLSRWLLGNVWMVQRCPRCCGLRTRRRGESLESDEDSVDLDGDDDNSDDGAPKHTSKRCYCVATLAFAVGFALCTLLMTFGLLFLEQAGLLSSTATETKQVKDVMDKWTRGYEDRLLQHNASIDFLDAKDAQLVQGFFCILVAAITFLYLVWMLYDWSVAALLRRRKAKQAPSTPFWESWRDPDYGQLWNKAIWFLLLYLTVSYISLVKEALSVFDCHAGLDGVKRMSSHPEIACQVDEHDRDLIKNANGTVTMARASLPFKPNILWIANLTGAWMHNPLYGHETDVQYLGNYYNLRVLAGFFALLYGVGVPVAFITLMYLNRHRLKHADYLAKYGILTNKMGERFYWWEGMVTVRKCALTATTILMSPGSDVDRANDHNHEKNMKDNESAALVSLTIVMFCVTLQAWTQPYVDPDVNKAELLSLLASYFVLLVGLGYRTQESADGALRGENFVCTPLVPDSASWPDSGCSPNKPKGQPCDPVRDNTNPTLPVCQDTLYIDYAGMPCDAATHYKADGNPPWDCGCHPAEDSPGQTVPLLCAAGACLLLLLTLPLIWRLPAVAKIRSAENGTADDRPRPKGLPEWQQTAASCLLIMLMCATSFVVLTEQFCPDKDAAKGCDKYAVADSTHFYCRTHTETLDYLNFIVYLFVILAVAYSFWVFTKKFGMLLDSFGMSTAHRLDNDLVDMLHKGMVGTANAWAADQSVTHAERAKARDVMGKVKQFKLSKGVKYDKNFVSSAGRLTSYLQSLNRCLLHRRNSSRMKRCMLCTRGSFRRKRTSERH